jgi:hypothetical protein
MKYYIVTTTKFAQQCLEYSTYGATQSNWLANVNTGDTVFLSQFNYKTQQIFGPFNVTKQMFYNKSVIYPTQKYFYRIQFSPANTMYAIEETDLYLRGIQCRAVDFHSKLINLIQQNKHLHCISLTDKEGGAICGTLQKFGTTCDNPVQKMLDQGVVEVNREYIWQKNKLDKKYKFASESDLETYVLLSLKNKNSDEYEALNKILAKWSGSGLANSTIYNQFIFGNAYPADIVMVSDDSINVFELKRDSLTNSIANQIEKEIRKHLYYSLLSERVTQENPFRVFNFYLVCLCEGDQETKRSISNAYESLRKRIRCARENNLIFLEYELKDDTLSLFQT